MSITKFSLTHAGKGLQECPGILVAAIGIKVAGVAIMVFFFAATILGAFVGKVQVSLSTLMNHALSLT